MAGLGTGAAADRVAAAAGALYGLPLADFTAARAEQARQARADGDREAAAVIGKLPKPNAVAWLANQLARQDPGQLRPLLELGESLRQATADLDAGRLRQLSRQQREVVADLVGRARELAAAAGQGVSDGTARGLEDTLHAALADEQAASQLTHGQLAAGLSRTGFPGIDSAGSADAGPAWPAPARKGIPSGAPGQRTRTTGPGRPAAASGPARPGRKAGPGQQAGQAEADRRAAEAAAAARRQQFQRAQRAEADARADAREAGREQDRARSALTQAEAAVRQADEAIGRLQDELDVALDARNNAGRTQRQARKDADRADRASRQAERRLAEATGRREQLERDA